MNTVLFVAAIFALIDRNSSVSVSSFTIRGESVPEKGSNLTLVCDLMDWKSNDGVRIELITKGELVFQISCIPSFCFKTRLDNYTFLATETRIFINITQLKRDRDDGIWKCFNKTQQFQVYTSPVRIDYSSVPTQPQDLSINGINITCAATTCSYPAPTFTWYYTEGTGQRQKYSTPVILSADVGSCGDSEKIYSSTLKLHKYTTFPENDTVENTVTFQCELTFPTLELPIKTTASPRITFAVKVSSVTLHDWTSTPSSSQEIQVTSDVPKTVTCSTGQSRPTATIIWYIGLDKQAYIGTNFSFTPTNEDHSKTISCRAYNTQAERDAVSSNMPKLYVIVKVSSVTLHDGTSAPSIGQTIQVTNGVQKTLTCLPGFSRPNANITWYFGTVKQQETRMNFSFIPTNTNNDKVVYCEANNIDATVTSEKPTLYVRVLATTPILLNQTSPGNLILLAGNEVNLICVSSATRPAASVKWSKGTIYLGDIGDGKETVSIDDTSGLMTVTSVLTFTPVNDDNGKVIKCETSISGQANKQRSQQTIYVWWSPSEAVIETIPAFPWRDHQTNTYLLCKPSTQGNPESTITWTTKYGKPNATTKHLEFSELSSIHNNHNVTCELSNGYTQMTGRRVISSPTTLDVMYKPIVSITINNEPKQTVSLNEGHSLIAVCIAEGNPDPAVTWPNRNSSDGQLYFKDIDRRDDKMYTCQAYATYIGESFLSETSLDVIVNYAPDVAAVLSSSILKENSSITILCNASGRPDKYTYTALEQKWMDTVIPNTNSHITGMDQYSSIDIASLQFQDTGEYICHVNNGIRNRSGEIDQTATVKIQVEVSPKILPQHVTFTGNISGSVNISVPFYSYPTASRIIFVRHTDSAQIHNDIKNTVSHHTAQVRARFYGVDVTLDGHEARLQITDIQPDDFGEYTLNITNSVGTTLQTVVFILTGPPSKPESLMMEEVGEMTAVISWIRGFHGGYDQTFVLQLSEDSRSWFKNVYVPGGQQTGTDRINATVDSLSASTTYYIRMYAFSVIGNSTVTNILCFSTAEPIDGKSVQQSPSTGAVVGGIMGGLVFIALVALSVVLIRRYQFEIICHKKQGNTESITPSRHGVTSTDPNTATTDSVPYYNTADLSDPSSQYTSLAYRDLTTNNYESLHNIIELQTTQPSTTVYENLKI